jgi:hypothetical protein
VNGTQRLQLFLFLVWEMMLSGQDDMKLVGQALEECGLAERFTDENGVLHRKLTEVGCHAMEQGMQRVVKAIVADDLIEEE